MEDNMTFDIEGILSEEEANKLFEEIDSEDETRDDDKDEKDEANPDDENDENEPDAEDDDNHPGKVGEGENEDGKDTVDRDGDGGSSPTVFSSIAAALKEDGIFPDFSDEDLKGVKTPEDFAELVQKAVNSQVDEKTRRVDEALNNGVKPDQITSYENTINHLETIDDDAVSAEGDDGEQLRKNLIYNDYINRGYSKERAMREVEKSFKTGSDIDDAKDSLEALKAFYKKSYQDILDNAKANAEKMKADQKKQADAFKKMILEDDLSVGDTKLDKRSKQKVYDAVSKPVYKDPETGKLLTAVQKFQKENPLEFLKQLGVWFVMTDGGKSMSGLVKEQVRTEKKKGLRELERKLNSSTINMGGSLRYDGSSLDGNGDDLLLSDDWKIM